MCDARRALGVVPMPDGIYAIGGYDGQKYLNSMEKYCLITKRWIRMKPMNTARCTLSAVASADCQFIYVLGGYNGQPLDLVERYSILTDTWEYLPPMITKRFMHQSVNIIS
jgi:Kelch motif